jgi:hypothetical protein
MPKSEPASKLLATVPKPPAKARRLSGTGTDSSENGPPSYKLASSEASDPLEEAGNIAGFGPIEVIFHIYRVPIGTLDGIFRNEGSIL